MFRTSIALVAALAIAATAATASAQPAPPETHAYTLRAPFAYVDAPAPGRLFTGTIFKHEQFKADRSARVKSGPAKGLWRHGIRTARDAKTGRTYETTGWVKASAFCRTSIR